MWVWNYVWIASVKVTAGKCERKIAGYDHDADLILIESAWIHEIWPNMDTEERTGRRIERALTQNNYAGIS